MSLRQKNLSDSKSRSRSSSRSKQSRKPKRLTKTQLRQRLMAIEGSGWSSKMVDNPKKTKIGSREYDVTLADKYEILKHHRKQLVEPLLKGKGIKVKIDKASFIQQEEAYDGEKTDVVYQFAVPKRAQTWLKKEDKKLGTPSYNGYLEEKHGDIFMREYWDAEQKALEKTFGNRGANLAKLNEEVWSDEWDSEWVGVQVWNEWHSEFENQFFW